MWCDLVLFTESSRIFLCPISKSCDCWKCSRYHCIVKWFVLVEKGSILSSLVVVDGVREKQQHNTLPIGMHFSISSPTDSGNVFNKVLSEIASIKNCGQLVCSEKKNWHHFKLQFKEQLWQNGNEANNFRRI